MNPGDIAIMVFIAFVSAGMTALNWRQISDLRQEVRAEISGLRTEMRAEFRAFRSEIHGDITSLRADLTQVALAVGVNRPRASGS